MSEKRLHPTANPYEQEFGYHRAVRKGNLIFVSGTTSLDPTTGKIQHVGSAKEQTLAAFAEGIKAVKALDGSIEDIVRVRIFVKNHLDTRSVGEALEETFGCVGVAATMVVCSFVDPDMLVEIELDAVVG